MRSCWQGGAEGAALPGTVNGAFGAVSGLQNFLDFSKIEGLNFLIGNFLIAWRSVLKRVFCWSGEAPLASACHYALALGEALVETRFTTCVEQSIPRFDCRRTFRDACEEAF